MTDWQPIETAPKDKEILALSPAWGDGRRPILLRWFKYNGSENWRDWDADPHFPTHWMPIPELPPIQRQDEEAKPMSAHRE